MMDNSRLFLNRRSFLNVLPGAALMGGAFWKEMSDYPNIQDPQELKTQLTAEEEDWIKQSSMAQEILNYFTKGYSCAESILMVSLRYLKKPEEFVWPAAGFGGGMGQKDLCGFLTGGIMGLGMAAGTLPKERKEARKACSAAVEKFWTWWNTEAPIHCSGIIQPGGDYKVCQRLGLLSTAKIQELIKSLIP